MAMENITTGVLTPELWAKELQRLLLSDSVFNECVNRKYEGEIKQKGDKVHIQTPSEVSISTYTEGTPIAYGNLQAEDQELVIDQQKYFAFKVPDIQKVQANFEFVSKYLANTKKALLNVQDLYILGQSANVPQANQVTAGTLTPDNVYKTFLALFEKLATANALDSRGLGADGKRPWVIVNPYILNIIKLAPEMKHATAKADELIRKGSVMEFAGFDVKMTTNLAYASGTNKATILAGTTEAITFAQQITKTETMRAETSFDDLVRGLYVYGAKTVQPKALASYEDTKA